MNTKRVNKLIDFMASLPKSATKHFNMRQWFAHVGAHPHPIKGKYIQPGDLAHCGTTACALGWAAVVPSFRRAGLKVERNSFDCDSSIRNFSRARKFFGLKREQADTLFGAPMSNLRYVQTPKQWAKGARKLMRAWAEATE